CDAQRGNAPRRHVAVAAIRHRGAYGIDHRRRRMKIRFAEFEVNDRAPLFLEFLGAGKDSEGALSCQFGNPRCHVLHSSKSISFPMNELSGAHARGGTTLECASLAAALPRAFCITAAGA